MQFKSTFTLRLNYSIAKICVINQKRIESQITLTNMVFKCQKDSFLKEFTTKVVSCDFAILEWTQNDSSSIEELRGFNVVCEDTILFPESGGQPCDYGTIAGEPVRNVFRRGSEAVHFVETKQSFEEGAEVKQCLDWKRRFDHMQQHSGQHLITSLFDREFKYDTTSWFLGGTTAYIELSTPHLVSRESLDLIEAKANVLIREGREVSVMLVDPEMIVELSDAHVLRSLLKDHECFVRIVRIEGIESNVCCGTHMTNLTQLQCVKLLYAEKSKNNVRVHFVVGERALHKLGECVQRELQLNLALRGCPEQHLQLIQKLQNNLKALRKTFEKLLKDFARAEAEQLENVQAPHSKYFTLHRKDGIELVFINTFLRIAPKDPFYFLTVSEDVTNGSKGHLVLRGDNTLIQKFGPLFMEILDGKGIWKDNIFQGKFNAISKIPECEKLLEEHFRIKKIDN